MYKKHKYLSSQDLFLLAKAHSRPLPTNQVTEAIPIFQEITLPVIAKFIASILPAFKGKISSKNNKNRIAHSGYTSSDSDDDDVCFLGEVTAKSRRRITSLTIDDSSSEDEPRLKKKRLDVNNDSNDSSGNESINEQWGHQIKRKPEKTHLNDKRKISERPEKEFVIDRSGMHCSSFAQDFHHCEVCNLSFNTYNEYLMHMQDRQHQKIAKSMGRRMRSVAENYPAVNGIQGKSSRGSGRDLGCPPVPPGVTRRTVRDESAIQSRIENNFPPCPGLEHITEIRGLTDTSYFCGICGLTFDVSSILKHLRKANHQCNTLKALDPHMYDILRRQPRNNRRKILVDMLRNIQEKDGIGRIVVKKDYLDEDKPKGNGFLQTLDTPGTSSSNRGVPLYEVTHSMPFFKDNQILSDKSKIDYYCTKCECSMFDGVMWKSHSKRNPFLKGLRKYPAGMSPKTVEAEHKPGTVAFLLDRVCYQDEPVVGLDYVREFQHEDKKETYHCIICGECLNCIDITQHVASLNHRLKYIECINHPSFDYVQRLDRRENKTFYKVEEICRTIQSDIGRGTPQVYIIKNQKDD